MPQYIDFLDERGVVEFPDDATREQIIASYNQKTPSPTALDYAKQITGSAIRSAARNLASTPRSIAIGAAELNRSVGSLDVPGTGDPTDYKSRLLYKVGDVIEGIGEDLAPAPVESLKDSFWATEVPAAVGSGLAFLTGGAAAKAGTSLLRRGVTKAATRAAEDAALKASLAKGSSLASKAAGTVAAGAEIGALGATSQFQNAYEDAISKGADRDTALKAGLLNLPIGATEIVPLGNMLSRIDNYTGGGVGKLLATAGKESFEEFLQELGQTFASNYVEKKTYNEDKNLLDDLASSASAGGISGFLLSAITSAIGGKVNASRRQSAMRRGEAARRQIISDAVSRGELLNEGSPNATGTGTTTALPSQQAKELEQAPEGGLRVRNAPQNRVETQTREAVIPVENEEEKRLQEVVTPPISQETITGSNVQKGTEMPVGAGESPAPVTSFESRSPIQRIPIQIQSVDGSVREGEFTGYYDLTSLGKGFVPSVGWTLPDGNKTHGMLKPDESIVGDVPTPEQWKTGQQELERKTESIPNAVQPIGIDAINARLAELGAGPQSMIEVVEDPSVPWDARSQFSGTNPVRIQLNAAKIGSLQQLETALEHEASHIADMSGAVSGALSEVSDDEKVTIFGDMLRLGYKGDPQLITREFNARGVEALVNAWNGRAWYEKLVGYIAEIASRFGIPMSRLGAERAAARAVGKALSEAYQSGQEAGAPTESFESRVEPRSPNQFTTRQQVELAVKDPLLKPAAQQYIRDLAKVQAGMVNDQFMGWWMATPDTPAEKLARDLLSPIADRRFVSDDVEWIKNLPDTTDEERQAKEVAGAVILSHYGFDRSLEQSINASIASDESEMSQAVKGLVKMNVAKMKAAFLDAMVKHLPQDYKKYLASLSRTGPKGKNLQAEFQANLALAERRLNTYEQSPTALQHALQAIAVSIPDQLLEPKATTEETNKAIIAWVKENGMLNTIVGDEVKDWLLNDKGNGIPALEAYIRLAPDLALMKKVLANQEQVLNDIKAFEQWFRPSGKTGKVSAKAFAEAYFKFRTGRNRALEVVKEIEKRIDDLDTSIHGNMIARDRLQELMQSPAYRETVTEASKIADVVVRATTDIYGKATGIIERGGPEAGSPGLWRIKGPESGTEYIIDLFPTSAIEKQNQDKLKAASAEMRFWADGHQQENPLLSNEYRNYADYIDRHLTSASLNPEQGFTQLPRYKIWGTNTTWTPDPFDYIGSILGGIGLQIGTVKDILERIGGRAALQGMKDMHILDVTMRKVEAVNTNPKYGYNAQTEAALKALKSHEWGKDQSKIWNEEIAERIIASHQNRIGRGYEAGDTIVGTGHAITKEDMDAVGVMKKWSDEILKVAPPHISDQIGNLQILRKAIGSGNMTMARTAAMWTLNFAKKWKESDNDAKKWALINHGDMFNTIIMGMIGETNPEFALMNNASEYKSKLFNIYRTVAKKEMAGTASFTNEDQLLDFIANEMVDSGMASTFTEGRDSAKSIILNDVTGFVNSFIDNVIEGKNQRSIWGAVPESVVNVATANNSFTIPRGQLQAPSTFYSYSTMDEGRRLQHVGSLRSLLNLKVIQDLYEAKAAIEKTKVQYDDIVKSQIRKGYSEKDARMSAYYETKAMRRRSEIRYDYLEMQTALKALTEVTNALERYESGQVSAGEHAGVAAANNVMGAIKSFALAGPQAITTNFFSGSLLGPAIFHAQTGQWGRAIKDATIAPHMWKSLIAKVSHMIAGDPKMSAMLDKHKGLFEGLAEAIIRNSADWQKASQIAKSSGMVTPYNLKQVLRNRRALKSTLGAFRADTDAGFAAVNAALSAPGLVHMVEGTKAVAPRFFDILINYGLIFAHQQELNWLKTMGASAFKRREESAGGEDWKDFSNPDNLLTPGDLGLKTYKGLQAYRDMFIPLGSIENVLLDYYERTKGMSPEDAANVPLIDETDQAALALDYAAKSNVAVESNRPPNYRAKGSDGVWRSIVTTFMGWVTNWVKQISKLFQRNSKDPAFDGNKLLSIAVIVALAAAVGAWNWEFGDTVTKALFNQDSARIKAGNIQDWQTGLKYLAQALPNVIPLAGNMIASSAGIAFTGRGNPLDVTSQSLWAGAVNDTYGTIKRIIETGDVTLPLADFLRRWTGPIPKAIINRLPSIRGLVDQNNAIRALNASAPPGTELKWGQRGSGGTVTTYGPANDEIQYLIASAYEVAAHGGSIEEVYKRRNAAVEAFVKTGRSYDDAVKAVNNALSAKEPVRVLTGRELTPEEERRWIGRMTTGQKKAYDTAVAAWRVLGAVNGTDLNMVSEGRSGGYGSVAAMPARRISLGATLSPTASPSSRRYSPTRISGMRSSRTRVMRGRRSIGRSRIRRMRQPGIRRSRGLAGQRSRRYIRA